MMNAFAWVKDAWSNVKKIEDELGVVSDGHLSALIHPIHIVTRIAPVSTDRLL